MFTVTQILTVLIAGAISAITAIVVAIINRKKGKQETESIVVGSLNVALNQMRQQIEDTKHDAVVAKAEAKLAQEQNDDCEFEHGITRMQLNKVLDKLEMNHWIKSSVFVLDDNETVIKVFEHRFKTIPVVSFRSFVDADMCLMEAQREQPEILVLDYMLSHNRTAQDIIKELGYEPEIFIMSSTKDYEVIFKDTDIRFFYKDRHYIRNITKAIMEHLIFKNK